jgi:hypothetical protein
LVKWILGGFFLSSRLLFPCESLVCRGYDAH